MTDHRKDPEAIARLILRVRAAYVAQRNPIPDSDLDNEQPVTLMVSTTLGDLRAMDRALTPSPVSASLDERASKQANAATAIIRTA